MFGFGRKKDRPEGDPEVMRADELLRALDADSKPLVLDVREIFEWRRGHIPGALHIPLGHLQERVAELPKDRPIVAICASGHRSGQATRYLRGRGLDARNLLGGYAAWRGPVIRN